MTNRRPDKKISNFIGNTSLPADAELTFVAGGVNQKIALSDFLAALGVTGTIVQDGDPAGTPVLDVAGSVNNIRNIEPGSGIQAAVSAQNGVALAHDFLQDTVGVPVLINPTASQPTIASLEPGAGISIVQQDEHIEISLSGAAVTTKTVVVNELSDLPSPVGGVITLEDDKDYLFITDVDFGVTRLVPGNNTLVRGADSSIISITYSDTGTFMTAVDKSFRFDRIKVSTPNGQLLDVSATVPGCVFQLTDMTIGECDTIGSLDGLTAVQLNNVAWNDIKTDGISFTGTNTAFYCQDNLVTLNGGTFIDLDAATFEGFTITNPFVIGAGGTTFLSGAASSANINVGGLGTVLNARISGSTPLSGVTSDDSRWNFLANDGIADTRPDGLLSVNIPFTVTISAVDTPVRIGAIGTDWIVERASQFTGAGDGRLTYDGEKNATLPILASLSAEVVSGTNKDLTFYIAIDGVIVANSGASTTVSSGAPKNTPIPWQDQLSSAQYVEVWVENNTDATNVLINSGVLRVN
jgi:hypothetical protein